MALLIGIMALLATLYAGPYLQGWADSRAGIFFSVFLLLVTGLLGIVVTGDLFNLYVFLEISSLAGYALLSVGNIRSVVAAFSYLIVGTIAATFYLLGIGYLYALTGSLNMADVAARLPSVTNSSVFIIAVAFISIACRSKPPYFPCTVGYQTPIPTRQLQSLDLSLPSWRKSVPMRSFASFIL